jgi:hypothetical protein
MYPGRILLSAGARRLGYRRKMAEEYFDGSRVKKMPAL